MFRKKENTTVIAERKRKKKIKPWKIVVLVVVLLIVIRFAAGALMGGGENLLPAVDVAEARRGDITSTLDTSGTIASELTRVYASPVDALVGEVPVVVGQKVNRGDYLLTYDTASLQKSYDIAELQAKAEDATASDSLTKSSENAADLASSAADAAALRDQINALNAEITNLQNQATGNEVAANNNAAVSEEVTKLRTELEEIKARISSLQAKQEQGTLSDKEKETLKQLKKDQKEKEKAIEKKEKKLANSKDIANNTTNIQAQLTQKNSQLADLQSKLAEAESKNSAAEAGVLSDAAKANIDYTQKASKLTLEQSADNLSKAKAGVTADFDGIVSAIQVSAGSIAAEGTALLTLSSANDMCLEVPVSKYNLANVEIGQKATITFQDREYSGSVSYMSKIAEKNESGASLVTVKVHIDAPDDNLVIGLDAKVSIDFGTAGDVILVPISSVNSDTEGDFVYVVNEGVVEKKYVTTGMSSSDSMEIKSGIEQGEKVITTVDSTITEGMMVTESVTDEVEDALTTEAAAATEAAE